MKLVNHTAETYVPTLEIVKDSDQNINICHLRMVITYIHTYVHKYIPWIHTCVIKTAGYGTNDKYTMFTV